jgi:hypothetical protein
MENHTAEYRMEALEEFSGSSAEYFKQMSYEKTMLEMSSLSAIREDPKTVGKLSEDLARLNLAYFQGRLDLLKDCGKIREEWKKEAPESFWNYYIESMFQEEIRDHTHLRIQL